MFCGFLPFYKTGGIELQPDFVTENVYCLDLILKFPTSSLVSSRFFTVVSISPLTKWRSCILLPLFYTRIAQTDAHSDWNGFASKWRKTWNMQWTYHVIDTRVLCCCPRFHYLILLVTAANFSEKLTHSIPLGHNSDMSLWVWCHSCVQLRSSWLKPGFKFIAVP